MMKLYHGSNIEVRIPEIRKNLRALDFGAGFYVTSSYEQAMKWAKAVTKRRGNGTASVSVYNFDAAKTDKLNVLKFEIANGDWLDFVVKNRKLLPVEDAFDLIIGPVANDSTLPVIDDYMDGKYTKEQAVSHLLPQNLTDQYAFLTDRALLCLSFDEVRCV